MRISVSVLLSCRVRQDAALYHSLIVMLKIDLIAVRSRPSGSAATVEGSSRERIGKSVTSRRRSAAPQEQTLARTFRSALLSRYDLVADVGISRWRDFEKSSRIDFYRAPRSSAVVYLRTYKRTYDDGGQRCKHSPRLSSRTQPTSVRA